MTRRRSSQGDSLDLLLDTICNTFGGILFIAMLVVVLVQNSAPPTEPLEDDSSDSAVQFEDLDSQLSQLARDVETLEEASENQRRLLERFAPEEIQQKVIDRNEAIAARNRVLDEKDRVVSEIAQAIVATSKANADAEAILAEAQTVDQELTAAKLAAKRDREARTRSNKTPVARATEKSQIGLILRYGRLYLWHHYGPSGERLGLNTDDFVVVGEEKGGVLTTPRPNGGVSLDGSPESQKAIRKRLNQFDSRQFYFLVVVRPDSFEAFHQLKDEIASMGFEYAIMPMKDGAPIVDRGGGSRPVQ